MYPVAIAQNFNRQFSHICKFILNCVRHGKSSLGLSQKTARMKSSSDWYLKNRKSDLLLQHSRRLFGRVTFDRRYYAFCYFANFTIVLTFTSLQRQFRRRFAAAPISPTTFAIYATQTCTRKNNIFAFTMRYDARKCWCQIGISISSICKYQ